LSLESLYIRYVLVGLYRDENFTYARVAIVPNLKVSLIVESKAREIKCIEKLDQKYYLTSEVLGVIGIDSVCTIDMVATVKGRQRVKLVLNVVKDEVLKKLACEAIFGSDTVLVLNPILLL
jgi:hypothetical protein